METARKITVEVPLDLLEKAQQASGRVSLRPSVRGCAWLRHRGPSIAYGNSEARFTSRARWLI